ncbi:unnamed protein product [Clonostachys rhizophaga]|uniref:Uncharacterized protein n=1 Tax=Clonostachys rhizophaga TaxID=160324 RepID=A0A9N9VQV6_9HYPO|nr:unnamed protein product [Clonostachys rhizophaga]
MNAVCDDPEQGASATLNVKNNLMVGAEHWKGLVAPAFQDRETSFFNRRANGSAALFDSLATFKHYSPLFFVNAPSWKIPKDA